MKIEKISINGRIFSPQEAQISATNQGFMFGFGAFETFCISNDKVFMLDEHFDRLEKSLRALKISWPKDRTNYFDWLRDLAKETPPDKDALVRFMVTGGEGDWALDDKEFSRPDTVIYLAYVDKLSPTIRNVKILKSVQRHKPEYFESAGFRIKAADYTSARFAKFELGDSAADGIMLTPDGFIAEALRANVFWTRNGQIYTPPLSTGILEGTTRLYLTRNHQIEEKLVTTDELLDSDEIFITSSVNYIEAVNKINGAQKPGLIGPIYKKLYQKLLTDIKNQSISL